MYHGVLLLLGVSIRHSVRITIWLSLPCRPVQPRLKLKVWTVHAFPVGIKSVLSSCASAGGSLPVRLSKPGSAAAKAMDLGQKASPGQAASVPHSYSSSAGTEAEPHSSRNWHGRHSKQVASECC